MGGGGSNHQINVRQYQSKKVGVISLCNGVSWLYQLAGFIEFDIPFVSLTANILI
jgi:hypothetical protein